MAKLLMCCLMVAAGSFVACENNLCLFDSNCKVEGAKCYDLEKFECTFGLCGCPEGKVFDKFEDATKCVDIKRPGKPCFTNTDCGTAQLECKNHNCTCHHLMQESNGICEELKIGDPCEDTCTPKTTGSIIKRVFENIACIDKKCQCKPGAVEVEFNTYAAGAYDGRPTNQSSTQCLKAGTIVTQRNEREKCHRWIHRWDDAETAVCASNSTCVMCPSKEIGMSRWRAERIFKKLMEKCHVDCEIRPPPRCCVKEIINVQNDIVEETLDNMVGICRDPNEAGIVGFSPIAIVGMAIIAIIA